MLDISSENIYCIIRKREVNMYLVRFKKKPIILMGIALFVLAFQGLAETEATSKGIILGYVYEYDGTTPIPGAVIKVKNALTGSEYESSVSDQRGIFKITGVESGIYKYSVATPSGEFIADSEFGLKMTESTTAKLAINVTPYSKKIDASIAGMPPPREVEGETFVGRVVEFDPNTRLAEIFIMQNNLEIKDQIHTLGEFTDFYQKVGSLEVKESLVRTAVPGQTALVHLEDMAQVGDAVYVTASRAPFPFLAPLAGVATVVAGSSLVAYNFGRSNRIREECEPCSPFQTRTLKSRKKNR
jgi:hypothetical protein